MNSENFSYNKISLLRSLILGILVYTIGYYFARKIPQLLTFRYVVEQAQHYKQNLKEFTCMSPEKQKKIGYTFLKNIIINLNTVFNFGNYKNYSECDKLTLTLLPKLYLTLMSASSSLLLFKLISNYTINTIIGYTISSNVKVSEFNINDKLYKPKIDHIGIFFLMILYFLIFVLIISLPFICVNFIMGFKFCNLANYRTFKEFSFYNDIFNTLRILLCSFIIIFFLIAPLIFIIVILLDKNSFINTISKDILYKYFNQTDHRYVNQVYEEKNNLFTNYGIWLVIFIVLLFLEYKVINNLTNSNNLNSKYYLLIFLSMFAFCLFIAYKKYNISQSNEQNIFENETNTLTQPMNSISINNLLQGIIKYNYPCMNFTNINESTKSTESTESTEST